MSARRKFFFNGALLTIVGLSVKTASLLFGAFISRAVGAEGTGLFTLVMTVYSFALTFATSGISLTVTRLGASAIGEGDSRGVSCVMRAAVAYALVFSSLATVALLFGADFLGTRVLLDERAILSIRILSFSLIPTSLSAVIAGYFVGIRRVVTNAAVQVATQLFKITITVILVIKMAENGTRAAVGALCLGLTVSEAVAFLILFVEYMFERRKYIKLLKSSRGADLKGVLSMALPLAFSAYIRSGLLTLEHILIPKQLAKGQGSLNDALAEYGTLHGMALPLVLYPMSPLSSFAGLLVPEFAESLAMGDRGRMKRITEESLHTTLAYATVAAVMLYIFSEELGYVIYNSYGASRFIAMIAPIIPIMYLDHVTDAILKGIGEQVYSMWVNISDSVLSIILVLILIPKMGVSGYAIVIIVMEAYNFILSLIRLKSKVEFTFKPIKAVLLPLMASLGASAFTREIFRIRGRSVGALGLFILLAFSLCLTLAALIALSSLLGRQRRNREGRSLLKG